MAFAICGIDHLVLRVRDEAASLAFYCDALGCVEERRLDGLGLIQLRAGASLIDILPVSGELGRRGGAAPGDEGRNMDHLCLRIEPWDEAALFAHLRAHGIEPGEAGRRYGADGQGPSIYIADPDGNTVELKGPPEE
ncbi:MAG: VOC family protein [Proteobacteria bacterium]|nr:VOC family protein [Pseudomonadota bacterium]